MGNLSLQKITSPPAVTIGITFLAIIAIYSLFYIVPSYLSFSQTRQAMAEQSIELERLKTFFPVFARSKNLNQSSFKGRLSLPARESIHRKELSALTRDIFERARRLGMTIAGSHLDINTLKSDSRLISMDIHLQGGLFDFRTFLIDVMSFKSFGEIKALHINLDENQMKQYTLSITIKIKAKRP